MSRKTKHGGAAVEFALSLMVLVPLLLGVVGLGLSLQRQMLTVQLARDAGSMSARKIKFDQPGNQLLLNRIAGSLNLTAGSGPSGTAGSGSAVLILSTMQYVNAALCGQASPPLAADTAHCPNLNTWVFASRIVVGNNTLAYSSLGTPPSSIIGADGTITINNQCLTKADQITGPNPWASTSIPATDLAVIQTQPIFVSEAAAAGFRMPPFTGGVLTYAQLYF